jgi:hypothetical protein
MRKLTDLEILKESDWDFLDEARDIGRLNRPMILKNSGVRLDDEEVRRFFNIALDESAQGYVDLYHEHSKILQKRDGKK